MRQTVWEKSVELTQQLVKINSISSFQEKGRILDFVAEQLNDAEVAIIEPQSVSPYLVAKTGCRAPEFRLILSGHLDTVDVGGMGAPFDAELRDGYLYGRGSTDMKGGCAAMLTAFREFAKSGNKRGEATLIFTLDEEIGSYSAQHAVEHELPQADLAIIGEPSKLSLITSHKGSQWIKVAFHGKSCHASMPEKGLNAVVMAAHFINALEEYTEEQFPGRKHEFCGSPTINVGTIRSDNECPNIVPERCEIVIDRRWVPNETIELVWKDVSEVIAHCEARFPGFCATIEVEGMDADKVYPPLDFTQQRELLARLTGAIVCTGVAEIAQEHFSGWTEGALFERSGSPAVIFGPGDFEIAHTLGERIEVEQIVKATKAYCLILEELCGDSGKGK